jgi:hypothetical protein
VRTSSLKNPSDEFPYSKIHGRKCEPSVQTHDVTELSSLVTFRHPPDEISRTRRPPCRSESLASVVLLLRSGRSPYPGEETHGHRLDPELRPSSGDFTQASMCSVDSIFQNRPNGLLCSQSSSSSSVFAAGWRIPSVTAKDRHPRRLVKFTGFRRSPHPPRVRCHHRRHR